MPRSLPRSADEFNYQRDNSTSWLMQWLSAPHLPSAFGTRLNGVDASNYVTMKESGKEIYFFAVSDSRAA